MDELRFCVLFNSIPVTSGRWEVDTERLCAMELRLRLRRLRLERGSNSVRWATGAPLAFGIMPVLTLFRPFWGIMEKKISVESTVKWKCPAENPKNRTGLVQMIRMVKSTSLKEFEQLILNCWQIVQNQNRIILARGYKKLMLNSADHEIFPAHKC